MFNAKKQNTNILALSWNIATEPKLYRELAPNPYSPEALKIISTRFSDMRTADVIRAIIMAEPEDRFNLNRKDVSSKITKRLIDYCKIHKRDLKSLSKDIVYGMLSNIVFETENLREIEQNYSQNNRLDSKLAIVNFIENKNEYRPISPSKVVFTTAFLTLLFFFAQNNIRNMVVKNQVLGVETQKENQIAPSRLLIPKLNIDANIEYVGVTSGGAMATPNNTSDVGWFDLGPRPGDKGSAVIAGHFNGTYGQPAVFANLNKLTSGDKIVIKDAQGKSISFVVHDSRLFDPGYADDVFSPSDGAHLNLVTCDGIWDGTKKSYSKRLVVFADLI